MNKSNYSKNYTPKSNYNKRYIPKAKYNKKAIPNSNFIPVIKKKAKVFPGSNTLFLKHLVQTDFLFSKAITKSPKRLIDATVKIEKKNNFHVLNILRLNSRLKMFIRLLQGLRQGKSFCIHIWCRDPFITKAINIFLSKYNLKWCIKVSRLFPSVDSEKKGRINFLLILGKPWIQTAESLINNWVLLNRTFLVTKMNFEIEHVLGGFYKIQNELADYKKLFFMLVLIQKAIMKTKINTSIKRRVKKSVKTSLSPQLSIKSALKNKIILNKNLKESVKKIALKTSLNKFRKHAGKNPLSTCQPSLKRSQIMDVLI